MFVAYDKDDNRIYADKATPGVGCHCPVCGAPVRLRRGQVNRPHFAHYKNTDCSWGKDKDHISEWHLRMQSYFPRESVEYRFIDEHSKEVHIADVFDEESNSVIEFQKSSISTEEFISRCAFHINNGRRIAWVFDESAKKPKEDGYGRLGKNDLISGEWPYENLWFKWLRKPRKCLMRGPDIYQFADRYSVLVFTGTEGDVLHRIVKEVYDYEYVMLSFHNVRMKTGIIMDELFYTDSYWATQEPWKVLFDIKRLQLEKKIAQEQAEAKAKAELTYRKTVYKSNRL